MVSDRIPRRQGLFGLSNTDGREAAPDFHSWSSAKPGLLQASPLGFLAEELQEVLLLGGMKL